MGEEIKKDKQIEDKLDTIINLVLSIEKKMDCISKDTKKMDDHINFVDSIYDQVKSPFHLLMNSVNNFRRLKLFPFSNKKTELISCTGNSTTMI